MAAQPHAGPDIELEVWCHLVSEPAVEEVLRADARSDRTGRKECEPFGVRGKLVGQSVSHGQCLSQFDVAVIQVVDRPVRLGASASGEPVGYDVPSVEQVEPRKYPAICEFSMTRRHGGL